MTSFVYKTAVGYNSAQQLLEDVRETIKDLRRVHPELEDCSLIDLSLDKTPAALQVTLSFQQT
ncbi:MAG: hypothetical protein QM401_06285 [Bacillota bacterium]|nr:hypothetical protein [Bacillota bacterium]HHU60428.1 hypothetical protein [Natronincola sp.]